MNTYDDKSLPAFALNQIDIPTPEKLAIPAHYTHAPRMLLLYGSLRERSFSRFLTEEAARILLHFGAEVRIFDPRDLPIAGSVDESHPKVAELRALSCLLYTSPSPRD